MVSADVAVAGKTKLPLSVTFPTWPFVTTATGNCASGSTPLTWLTGSVPDNPPAVPAKTAYGVGVIGWRGASVAKAVAPFVRTAISSQLDVPVKAPAPKSTSTVNTPLVTRTALLVTGPAMATPLVLVVKSEKVRL